MTLDWAMLAESVQLHEGLAFVLGGGIDTLTVPELPAPFTAAVLIRLLLHRTEADHPQLIEVRFLDEDGNQLVGLKGEVRPHLSPDLPLGWDIPLMASFNLQALPLPRAGRYSIEILANSTHVKSLPLRVQLRVPSPSGNPSFPSPSG